MVKSWKRVISQNPASSGTCDKDGEGGGTVQAIRLHSGPLEANAGII